MKTIILHLQHGSSNSRLLLIFGPGTQNPTIEIINEISNERPCRLNVIKVEQK